MTDYSALSPVAAALFTTLNVAALTTLAPGGVHEDVPQSVAFPFVLVDVDERFTGGLGARRGTMGGGYEIAIRLHVYSQAREWRESQLVLAKALELLALAPAVTGFRSWAIFWDDSLRLADEVIGGLKCKELAQNGRLYVEAA